MRNTSKHYIARVQKSCHYPFVCTITKKMWTIWPSRQLSKYRPSHASSKSFILLKKGFPHETFNMPSPYGNCYSPLYYLCWNWFGKIWFRLEKKDILFSSKRIHRFQRFDKLSPKISTRIWAVNDKWPTLYLDYILLIGWFCHLEILKWWYDFWGDDLVYDLVILKASLIVLNLLSLLVCNLIFKLIR